MVSRRNVEVKRRLLRRFLFKHEDRLLHFRSVRRTDLSATAGIDGDRRRVAGESSRGIAPGSVFVEEDRID
jgi:hypothetical protein